MTARERHVAGLLMTLHLAGTGVAAETVGGLAVVPAVPVGHVAVAALDETGCRVPMLVWRCRGDTLTLLYAFDMEIPTQDAAALRFRVERDGAILAGPDAWPLTANRRNAELPASVTTLLVSADGKGDVVTMHLEDPASGSTLRDRFDLSTAVSRIAALPCTSD